MGDRLGAQTIKLLEFENGFHCSDIVQMWGHDLSVHFDVIGMRFLSLFFFLFKLRFVKAGTF